MVKDNVGLGGGRIKPIDGELVSSLWERDDRLLFEITVKLNEVIVALNTLATTKADKTKSKATK